MKICQNYREIVDNTKKLDHYLVHPSSMNSDALFFLSSIDRSHYTA